MGRSQADGFQRLALQPPFDGAAPVGFPFAIVLDDTLTQGGTLANLCGHLDAQGVQVIAATTLTGKRYSAKLNSSVSAKIESIVFAGRVPGVQ